MKEQIPKSDDVLGNVTMSVFSPNISCTPRIMGTTGLYFC